MIPQTQSRLARWRDRMDMLAALLGSVMAYLATLQGFPLANIALVVAPWILVIAEEGAISIGQSRLEWRDQSAKDATRRMIDDTRRRVQTETDPGKLDALKDAVLDAESKLGGVRA